MIELPAANAYSLSRSSDRRLFVGAAIGTLVVVFVGFARTYFLKYLYDTPALRWLVPRARTAAVVENLQHDDPLVRDGQPAALVGQFCAQLGAGHRLGNYDEASALVNGAPSAGAGSRGCRGHTGRDRCRRGVAMNAACGRLQMRRPVPARQLAAHDA